MASDVEFMESSIELISEVLAAIKRGMIRGTVAEQLTITILQIGGPNKVPLSLHRTPVRFAVPSSFILKNGKHVMATVGIRGDMGTKVPVEFDNIAGSPVPEPQGTPVVTSSDTAIANAVLDSDGQSVDIFPVQPPQDGGTFTVTYTLGSISFSQEFQITPDLNATQGHFVTTQDSDIPLPSTP